MVALIATWALVGLLLGGTGYVLIPWSLALLGGVDMRDRIGRYFIGQMMTVLGDAALIAREQGGLDLAGVGFQPEFSADRVTVAGEDGHLSDDLNVKSRLAGKGFGIGLESHGVYISPLFAEFAKRSSDAVHRGRIGLRSDGGDAPGRLDFEIHESPIVPDLRGAHLILDGDARRRYGVLSESWAQKSQEKFGKRISVGQTLILIAAFGIGSGMAILAARYGGSAPSGGGSTIPIHIALGAL